MLAVLTLQISKGNGQTEWTYYPQSPVLKLGQPGEWDAMWVEPMSVVFDGNHYHMWYLSYSSSGSPVIGHAASTDGISWNKSDENPILTKGQNGTWDGEFIGAGSVLFLDGTFYLWFYGQNSAIAQSGIGLATSSDGVHWTEYENNPVYVPNDPGDWDDAAAGVNLSVVFDGERYHMWYDATAGQPAAQGAQPAWRIGYASSDDGITWTACSNNPVLKNGAKDSWDWWTAMNPTVVKTGSGYHMWYYGDNAKSQIGYARSQDGMNWTKCANNPVLSPRMVGSWNLIGLMRPVVFYENSTATFKMWYCGGGLADGNLFAEIGYATAPDVTVGVENRDKGVTADCFTLYPNHPNPFNPATTITFDCRRKMHITVGIYDLLGRKIRTLVNQEYTAGHYTVRWSGTNERGQFVPGGIYIARFISGDHQQAIKLTLVR